MKREIRILAGLAQAFGDDRPENMVFFHSPSEKHVDEFHLPKANL